MHLNSLSTTPCYYYLIIEVHYLTKYNIILYINVLINVKTNKYIIVTAVVLTLPSWMSFSIACVTDLKSFVKKMYSAISSGVASTLKNDDTGGGNCESWKYTKTNIIYNTKMCRYQSAVVLSLITCSYWKDLKRDYIIIFIWYDFNNINGHRDMATV